MYLTRKRVVRPFPRLGTRLFSVLVAASTATVVGALPASAAAGHSSSVAGQPSPSPSGANCRDYYLPVKETATAKVEFKVYAQLCARVRLSAATPVQVLINGGTYDHSYWDWPYQPQTYSYVDRATRAGFATLNVDRLGYGHSDHPNPLTLDFAVAGNVIHQLVQKLRAGAFGAPFRTVVLNGHSMGGDAVEHEASTYHDVDAVIVSGMSHNITPLGLLHVADKFYPAELDPKFGLAKRWMPGYLTTVPGNRLDTFVKPGTADPRIGAVEEAHKDTLTAAELIGVTLDSYNPTITRNIRVPVLQVFGQHDLIWCATTQDCNTDPGMRNERTFFGRDYEQYVVPDSGHSINTTRSAPRFYAKTLSWLHAHHIG